MTPHEFACNLYQAAEIHKSLQARGIPTADAVIAPIPRDIKSKEFAEWLTRQYQIAMTKGIQIGRDWELWKD